MSIYENFYTNGNAKIEREMEEKLTDGEMIQNAGIVLLNAYLPMLFERAGLIENGKFMDTNSQIKAVQYLHYLSSGSDRSEENMLTRAIF